MPPPSGPIGVRDGGPLTIRFARQWCGGCRLRGGLGSGLGRPGAQVRWRVAGRMVSAWLITLPAAAIVGAIVIFLLLLAAAAYMYLRSRREPVGHHNVNDEWADASPAERVPARAAGWG